MPFSILNRYVLFELIRVFVVAQIAITGLFVTAFVVSEASQRGCGPLQLLGLLPIMVPWTLPYTVPATALYSVGVVYGRMARDSEITAIRAAGISLTRIFGPALLLGITLSGGIYLLYGQFIPLSLQQMRTTLRNNVEELIYTLLRRDLRFSQFNVNYSIWVQDVQGKRLIKPTFIRRNRFGKQEFVVSAKEAVLSVNLDKRTIKLDMKKAHFIKVKDSSMPETGIFDGQVIEVEIPEGLLGSNRKPSSRELTNGGIIKEIAALRSKQKELRGHMSDVKINDPVLAKTAVPDYQYQIDGFQKTIWSLQTEFAARPALALGSLCFILIGCPVSIWLNKGDYLSVFIACFLPIILTYYPLTMMTMNLGKSGGIEPTFVVWAGNALLASVGLFMMYRLIRR